MGLRLFLPTTHISEYIYLYKNFVRINITWAKFLAAYFEYIYLCEKFNCTSVICAIKFNRTPNVYLKIYKSVYLVSWCVKNNLAHIYLCESSVSNRLYTLAAFLLTTSFEFSLHTYNLKY